MDKLTKINQLKADILASKVCFNLANKATNLVMGEGDVDADIVFIGEAPGKAEDLSGRPFVGASGKLLDEMLNSINLKRQQVYITNIVKYRPPQNRDPSNKEKAEFLPYLIKQLDIIKPKVIVTLGRHAMGYFLPEAKISDVHGKLHEIELEGSHCKLLPLYHPAAALYNGSMKQILMSDFKNLAKLINQR